MSFVTDLQYGSEKIRVILVFRFMSNISGTNEDINMWLKPVDSHTRGQSNGHKLNSCRNENYGATAIRIWDGQGFVLFVKFLNIRVRIWSVYSSPTKLS